MFRFIKKEKHKRKRDGLFFCGSVRVSVSECVGLACHPVVEYLAFVDKYV